MNKNLQDTITALINKDTKSASLALKKHIIGVSSRIINEQMQHNINYVHVTYKCEGSDCTIKVEFPKGTDEKIIDSVANNRSLVQLERSVGGIFDDRVIDNRIWILEFTDVQNPEEFAQQYSEIIKQAYEQALPDQDDVNSDDDYDEYYNNASSINPEKDAIDAENDWLSGRGY